MNGSKMIALNSRILLASEIFLDKYAGMTSREWLLETERRWYFIGLGWMDG